jgi:hypothetical protein
VSVKTALQVESDEVAVAFSTPRLVLYTIPAGAIATVSKGVTLGVTSTSVVPTFC